MTEPDEERPSLSEALDEIASAARPVDLTAAVSRQARAMRRRRAAASALAVVAVVGAGAYAAGRVQRSDSLTQSPGAVVADSVSPTPSGFGWFAYAPLPSSGVTAPPSVLALTTLTVAPPPTVSPPVETVPVRTPPPVTLTTTPADVTSGVAVTPTLTSSPPRTTTPPPVAVTTPAGPTTSPVSPTTTQPSTPADPKPCKTFDDFAPGSGGNVTVTAQMKARAIAMGTALCAWAGGGQTYDVEEWVSNGGLSMGYVGLTYNIQAHITGAAAGPPTGEYWIAITQGTGTGATFPDGTQVHYETSVPAAIKAKIEASGSPFDAFAKG
jgi:hypothetical protein